MPAEEHPPSPLSPFRFPPPLLLLLLLLLSKQEFTREGNHPTLPPGVACF
jgi:hypothetical protein